LTLVKRGWPGTAAIGSDPGDVRRRRAGPRLDAAMALLDRRLGDEFAVRRVVEASLHIAFHGRLIALEREKIVGAVRDDLVRDVDLAAHGVDGDERAREPIGFGQVVEQLGNGGDFVGFLWNRELGQGQPGVGGVSAEPMQRLQPLAFVARAPRGLAVDGDEIVASRPKRRDPALETPPEHERIDAVDEIAQPTLARNAEMEFREAA